MIKRESYMRRIRPFINGELVKVMTGIRRSGKSVMLELVKQELLEMGVRAEQFISINFEDIDVYKRQALDARFQYRPNRKGARKAPASAPQLTPMSWAMKVTLEWYCTRAMTTEMAMNLSLIHIWASGTRMPRYPSGRWKSWPSWTWAE